MRILADFVLARPRLVLLFWAVTALLTLASLRSLRRSDDLLAFLPLGDRDVALFREVARKFGGVDIAYVGIEADDVLAPRMLEALGRASQRMRNLTGVDRVLSLSEMQDFVAGEAGLDVQPLIPQPLPSEAAAQRRLRAHVLGLEHLVGRLVSADGRAALILCFLAEGAPVQTLTQRLREIAGEELGGARLTYGGAPFASAYLFDITSRDVRRLTPLAAVGVVGVLLIGLGDAFATAAALGAVLLGILLALAVMALAGAPFTLASAAMPVVLLAAGGALGLHLLWRFRGLRGELGAVEAARTALCESGPPLLMAGLACAVGFLSFLVTDVRPMRDFGVYSAVGVVVALLATVTGIPAALALSERRARRGGKQGSSSWARRLEDAAASLARTGAGHPRLVLLLSVALLALTALPLSRVEVRMEPTAFFRPGSAPAEADAFLHHRFGGSRIAQLLVKGDLEDPLVLRQVDDLASFARTLPGVTQVEALPDVLAMLAEAMGAPRRIPDRRREVQDLLFFLEGDAAGAQLIASGRREGLIHVRIGRDEPEAVAAVLRALEGKARELSGKRLRAVAVGDGSSEGTAGAAAAPAAAIGDRRSQQAERVARRVRELARSTAASRGEAHEVSSPALLGLLRAEGARPVAERLEKTAAVASAVAQQYIGGDEFPCPCQGGGRRLATRVGRLVEATAIEGAIREEGCGCDAEDRGRAASSLAARMQGARRAAEVAGLLPQVLAAAGLRSVAANQRRQVESLLWDLSSPEVAWWQGPAAATAAGAQADPAAGGREIQLQVAVSGTPVLDRGFSRSVGRGLAQSLALALVLLLVVLAIWLGSPRLAAAALLPSCVVIAAMFAVLGLARVPLDIGTSLVASIGIGVGVGHVLFLAWRLALSERAPGPRSPSTASNASTATAIAAEAARCSGPPMLLSALVVALGFSALALADSAPMRFFGILTALSVSGAAVLALLLGPALLPPHGLARLRARALESAQMAAPLAKPSEKKR